MLSHIRYRILPVLFFISVVLNAQDRGKPAGKLSAEAIEKLHTSEDTLTILSYAVVNDSFPDMRFLACKSLITALVRALKTENSFRYPFERVKSVSILAPPDSSFRIFTWQLFVNDSTYRHYGAIQMNRSELKMFPLIDRRFEMTGLPTHEQLLPNRWYGAVYYNLRPFDTREGRKYLLFGFDGYSFFDKRKVLDVLSFSAAGEPVFGAPVFDRPDEKKSDGEQRIILEYTAEAKVRLNWDEQYDMIVLDHLIPYPSPYTGKMMYIPDGSYDGFKFEKGRWKFVNKIFNDAQEEAPRPYPVLDEKEKKNIFGKTGKPQKPKN
ncbi:MAG: hypothetical protein IPM98_06620 [Lewinellaceae bacterium]|nr:hypothetical protein [Lewinellaceae bacterium]